MHKRVEDLEKRSQDKIKQATRDIQREIDRYYGAYENDDEVVTPTEAQKPLDEEERKDLQLALLGFIALTESYEFDLDWAERLKDYSSRFEISREKGLILRIEGILEDAFSYISADMQQEIKIIKQESYRLFHEDLMDALHREWQVRDVDEALGLDSEGEEPIADESVTDSFVREKRKAMRYLASDIYLAEAGRKTKRFTKDRTDDNSQKAQNGVKRTIGTLGTLANNAGSMAVIKESRVKYYKNVAIIDNRTCKHCTAMDQSVFKVSEMKVGINAPIYHVLCRCSIAPATEREHRAYLVKQSR